MWGSLLRPIGNRPAPVNNRRQDAILPHTAAESRNQKKRRLKAGGRLKFAPQILRALRRS
jgi:hypothetical protein